MGNRENSGSVWQQKEKLQKIKDLDEKESVGPLSEPFRNERAKAKLEFQEIVIREEINWHQKSRMHWLWNGDNNTKIFHSYANSRRTNNRIDALNINGAVCDNPQEIEDHIISYFKEVYTKDKQPGACFHDWKGKTLTSDKAFVVGKTFFSEEEI